MTVLTAALIMIFFLALAMVLQTWSSKSASFIISALVLVATFIIFIIQFIH